MCSELAATMLRCAGMRSPPATNTKSEKSSENSMDATARAGRSSTAIRWSFDLITLVRAAFFRSLASMNATSSSSQRSFLITSATSSLLPYSSRAVFPLLFIAMRSDPLEMRYLQAGSLSRRAASPSAV